MPTISVLLVPVPEAEAAVAPFRRRLDPTYRQQMPAHVTVLVPFLAPSMIDDAVIGELTSLFQEIPGFTFALRETRWFDKRVLYLAPDPSEPFRRMTAALVERFPDHPPYEGAFEDVIPHVTIAEGGRWRRRRWRMRRAEVGVRRLPTITAQASEVWLMVLPDNQRHWQRVHSFLLA
jgi:2'-5' RNA ligase